ncbi:PR domain zinc finger protein 12 [Trichonephila inaurata madagascariensis]|uniref:PR domain zinc finger protein 12 n=1 Tax=Trichonephila inaurata madagascariensis TaxID=2747483 RepID=A0A8X7C0K2_9ARAC|nr:PR domain zinc finger protein 12 [Trichonephila inaurata madagascariensis]
MERIQLEKETEDADFPIGTTHSQPGPSENFTFDDVILDKALYGQWSEWNGQRPPERVRQKLLQNLPIDITRNIPEEVFLDVSTLPFQGIGIFAGITIEERTIIGPVPGRTKDLAVTNAEELDNAWEVADNNVQIQHILQMEHQGVETKDLWIALIQPARCIQEQNLETFEAGGSIYYRATKEIYAGEELLVWYGQHIEQCFGLPCFEPQKEQKKCIENAGASEDEKKKLNCVICHKGFNSRSNLRSHMRTHTQQKPFKCNVCFRRFSQSSTLRNHTRLHTGEKPYRCNTCHSAYSQLAGLRAHQKSSQHQPKLYFVESTTK